MTGRFSHSSAVGQFLRHFDRVLAGRHRLCRSINSRPSSPPRRRRRRASVDAGTTRPAAPDAAGAHKTVTPAGFPRRVRGDRRGATAAPHGALLSPSQRLTTAGISSHARARSVRRVHNERSSKPVHRDCAIRQLARNVPTFSRISRESGSPHWNNRFVTSTSTSTQCSKRCLEARHWRPQSKKRANESAYSSSSDCSVWSRI